MISLHVDDEVYRELHALAERTGRPLADLIRDAISKYLAGRVGKKGSILDLPPHQSGAMLRGWTREELLDEMLGL